MQIIKNKISIEELIKKDDFNSKNSCNCEQIDATTIIPTFHKGLTPERWFKFCRNISMILIMLQRLPKENNFY